MRNLVLCRAGAGSLHREWLGDPATRSYDVWLDCFDDDGGRWVSDPATVSVGRNTTKWPRVSALFRERPDALERYDAFWFPDDDLRVDAGGVERLFELFHALRLQLAQPALAEPSYWSHIVTLANDRFLARFTNFVEVMAPVFSREALRRCLPTFARSISGWGLDYVWPRILGDPHEGIAVLDGAPVVHTRPIGGNRWYEALGVSPQEEQERLMEQHDVALPYLYRQYGGVPAGGERNRARRSVGLGFALRLLTGAPRPLRVRRYAMRQVRSVFGGTVG
ncbi:MAG TPA: DUF707 domain-containing protein [Anaeromyxobacteraceae bacterium]|nr:DUF707 domain-containing protein [Anaeromyxobacteraceae bacterium]